MQMANVLGANLATTPVTFLLQPNAPSNVGLMPFWLIVGSVVAVAVDMCSPG